MKRLEYDSTYELCFVTEAGLTTPLNIKAKLAILCGEMQYCIRKGIFYRTSFVRLHSITHQQYHKCCSFSDAIPREISSGLIDLRTKSKSI